jgi:RNA recognition motif-containing protein
MRLFYYESGEDAKTAKEGMNGQKFNGRRIQVDFSNKKIQKFQVALSFLDYPKTQLNGN